MQPEHAGHCMLPIDVTAVLADITATLQVEQVPALYQRMAIVPGYLAASWERYQIVMRRGALRQTDKEYIALATVVAQGNDYMIAWQRQRLQQLGVTEAEIVEALAVADFFEGFDAFAHALHVDSDLRPRRLMAGDMSLVDQEHDVNVPYVTQSDHEVVKRVYQEIKARFGIPFIPNIFKALGHFPEALEAKWKAYKAIMLQGQLRHLTKEMLAIAVSAVNACFY
ncbi:MAG: carboxymuconolactone decarboxylase family protein [Candidatus Tectimicrobiota bacterium]